MKNPPQKSSGAANEDKFCGGHHIDFSGVSGGPSAAENRMEGRMGETLVSKSIRDVGNGYDLGKNAKNVVEKPGKNPPPGPTSEPQSRDR